ncbi:MAG: serine kinase [Clostridia bacterium]|nr:serine kinase [Clostridia bacterium]
MRVSEIADKLCGRILVDSDADVKAFYAGDFLSRVMGKAPSDSVWITVMGNVNVAGVAVLAEIKTVVVCEGVVPAPQLVEKCKEENIALVTTDKGVYECCRLVG